MFNLEKIQYLFTGFLTLINNEIGIFILFFVLVSKDIAKRIKTFSLVVLIYLIMLFINLLIINEASEFNLL